jgi:hypothetical protein
MRRNAKAQNFDFGKKKTAYFSGYHGVSSYVLTTQVLHTPEWTPTVLEKRQADLLNVMKDGWRL